MCQGNFPLNIVQSSHFDLTQLYVDCIDSVRFSLLPTSYTRRLVLVTFLQLDPVLLGGLHCEVSLGFPLYNIYKYIQKAIFVCVSAIDIKTTGPILTTISDF